MGLGVEGWMPSPTDLILRSPRSGRLEGRTTGLRASRRRVPRLLSMRNVEDGIGTDRPQVAGKTGFASANSVGKITLMSPFCTCVFTGAAPVFWPFTNFVGP